MYLDRHDVPGVSPEDVASAHLLDLEVQEKHGVHYHTYWFDPDCGSVFCLAEGPNKRAVVAVHEESHGLLASSILELSLDAPLNAFLGPAPHLPAGTSYSAPAMRVIVFTDVCGSVAQTHQLGDEGHMHLLREHDEIVRSQLLVQGGHEVKHTGDGIMASFTSVVSAITFAVQVQRRLHERNENAETPFHISIGISAGEPVTDDNDDLFGAAVQLAARLCAAAADDDIVVSMAVRELCVGKSFRFDDRGEFRLKGIPEPTHAYGVGWSD